MEKKAPKKSRSAGPPTNNNDTGVAIVGLAKEIAAALESVAEQLHPLSNFEAIADDLGKLSSALHSVADATAMSVIAQYGTDEDRRAAITELKRWFESGTF